MIRSIVKICNLIDEQKIIPNEWEKMTIQTLHKKGDKRQMKNKRGIFLTNILSKVYEKIIKQRNQEEFVKGVSQWQNGGMKHRSTIDNI